jgi:hypothetical protein
MLFSLLYILYPIGNTVLIAAPSGIHAIRAAVEHGFNPPDLPFFDLKQ